MINNNARVDRLVKAIILVTLLQSAIIIGLEVKSYFNEKYYKNKIEELSLFTYDENDFEYVPVLSSKDVITIA